MDVETLSNSKEWYSINKNKERATQILKAVEGMKIWEAKDLLEECIGTLNMVRVSYSRPCDDTTS